MNTTAVQIPEINPQLQVAPQRLQQQFQAASPFRHLVLQDFFDQNLLKQLVAQFPPFEKTDCRNEKGEPGLKGVFPHIAELGGAYSRLDRLVKSRSFLDWLSACTGIEQLLYDPFYFGGGTHENRPGQDLDLHIDFNLHPLTHWHRRLNLIVYLNEEWHEDWGGNLVLRQDPRDRNSPSVCVPPRRNCCVVFETTEHSWHGFERIKAAAPDQSRKSIALYFYTKTRPVAETASAHSTVYIEPPLPDQFKPGYTLGDDDISELQVLLKRRDDHLDRIYADNQRLQATLELWRNRFFGSRTTGMLRWCRYKYLLWKQK